MKDFLKVFFVALLVPTFALGAALDIRLTQRNSSNTAWMDVVFATENSALIGTTTGGLLSKITIGSGLDLTAGVLTASGGGGGAPTTATYITQTPNGSLSAEQALSLLSSGIMRVTTTTGVITSLGDPTTVGSSLMFTANPSAITFIRVNADNTISYLSDSAYKTALSLATVATSGSASDLGTGTLPAARMPALTGDITTSAGAVATTLATVNSNVGTFGNSTRSASITVNAKGLITAISNATITGGGTVSGPVSSTDNAVTRWNGTAGDTLQNSGVTIDDDANIVTLGNVSANVITGNSMVLGNLTTTNLGVTGNIVSTSVTDGQIFIGNNTGDRLQLGTLTAGDGISITNGAGTITINATNTGNVTKSGTPTSGQAAEWTSATNLQGVSVVGSGNYIKSPGGLTVTTGKVLSVSNTLTFTGTDSSSVAFGAGGTVIYSGGNIGAATATTLDTGQGANELYAMDQNVRTTDAPQFSNVRITNSTLTYSTTPAVDFSGDGFKTITLTGDATFSGSNYAAGRSVTVRIVGDSSTRNLAFDADWIFIGAAAPTTLAANKVAVLTLTSFTGADTGVIAAYSAQP